jgi:hypothetical protein
LRAIETVRAAVGADVHLMADYNQGLDLAEALVMGLDWIEEPIVYDNLDGYARLASRHDKAISWRATQAKKVAPDIHLELPIDSRRPAPSCRGWQEEKSPATW